MNGVPPNWSAFFPLARHEITIYKTTDAVIVHAEAAITYHGNVPSRRGRMMVDGKAHRLNDFYYSINGGLFQTLDASVSGLAVGTHVITTGWDNYKTTAGNSYYTYIPPQAWQYVFPNTHGRIRSVSVVTVVKS
jgi:hypothetical protein